MLLYVAQIGRIDPLGGVAGHAAAPQGLLQLAQVLLRPAAVQAVHRRGEPQHRRHRRQREQKAPQEGT